MFIDDTIAAIAIAREADRNSQNQRRKSLDIIDKIFRSKENKN